MISALTFLILGIGCYSISQLQQQGKLKGQKDDISFWGEKSYLRKYKFLHGGIMLTENYWGWKSRYYKWLGLKYRERWFTSTNFTVMFTDGYHACQALMFMFLSLSVTFAIGWNWWLLLGIWSLIHLVHWAVYKFLSK